MNLEKVTITLLLTILWYSCSFAQLTDWSTSVKVTKSNDGLHTQLNWDPISNHTFSISRRGIDDKEFLSIAEGIVDTFIVDENALIGEPFEYFINSFDSNGDATNLTFIYAGLEVARVDYRGRLLLLVDDRFANDLSDRIDRWKADAEGDGWNVKQINVSKDTTVTFVKKLISTEYISSPDLKSVFLLGHIPVPYSGNIVPDGHTNNHRGAWSADTYYCEMNELWTDHLVQTQGQPMRTMNIPKDGKFDNNDILTAELHIGRVDFFNLPVFDESELTLLENYLDKNHAFKNRHFTPRNKSVAIDKFNAGYDFVAKSNFPQIIGGENYEIGEYRTSLLSNSYLWSYGSGGGTYTSASGITNSQNFATDSLQSVFTILFGSYFGDFDSANNLLRASLGSGSTLCSFWGVRPNWHLHHMGLGTTIGRQYKQTLDLQIFDIAFFIGKRSRVHIALLGDPTLRAHMVYPVSDLQVLHSDGQVNLEWTWSHDDSEVDQFNIFIKTEAQDTFSYFTTVDGLLNTYQYNETEVCGFTQFMVKAEKLQVTPSGSYKNQSIGKISEILLPEIDSDNDGYCAYLDCDDLNADIYPGAAEIPDNQIDDNCNGLTDEMDEDNDGFFADEDCNDQDPLINSQAIEIPSNGIDENCDGIDDFAPSCVDTYTGPINEELLGFNVFVCDSLPLDYTFEVVPNLGFRVVFPSPESGFTFNFCDGYDEDIWTGLISLYYYNLSINGPPTIGDHIKSVVGCSIDFIFEPKLPFYSSVLIVIRDANNCNSTEGNIGNGRLWIDCIPTDNDNDGYNFEIDCDDSNESVNPGMVEEPYNGIDDDCNHETLDDDLDQDGFFFAEDCDDTNPNINPAQTEVEYNGLDDDCNVETLDDDLDQDGFLFADDCDDTNPNINPDAEEIPNNGIDEDCDGVDLVSSTHEISDSSIEIYPNPTIDIINIDVEGQIKFQANLYSLDGKMLISESNTNQINVATISAGTFLLEIIDLTTGEKIIEKIVIGK